MYTDTISDMLTRIRNAYSVHKDFVIIPHSKMKASIAEILKEEGYVEEVREIESSNKKDLKIKLKYFEDEPVMKSIERVSKPSQRVYVKVKDMPKLKGGLGVLIISTPKGVMSDKQARKELVGGEVICEVF